MLNIFKRRNQKRVVLGEWNVNPGRDFEMVDNGDSIQYVNKIGSVAIYLSVLEVKGRALGADEPLFAEPKIVEKGVGWELMGTKMGKDKVLVCVITFTDQNDSRWVKDYFSTIATI